MKTQVLKISSENALSKATELLLKGEVIAFPTDTVYGVGASIRHSHAIERIYTIKKRDKSKAIPILVGNINALEEIAANINKATQKLAETFWPGPLTLIVNRSPSLPKSISPYPTIGVRMPNHPFTLSLLQKAGPLAATSANISGKPSTSTALEVLQQLEGRIPLILDGEKTPGGIPSTVVDCTAGTPKIFREGPITLEQIQSILFKLS